MGRISEEDVMRVREATDLVQLISETVPLRQKGRLFWGLCPFHGEKTSSFKVDPGTQLWHCFGCGLGGDAFGYVMRIENLEFPEAARQLAERAHIEIREEAGGLPTGQRERLISACEATADFYHAALTSSTEAGAQTARDYLKGRGFGLDVAKRWKLGYASGKGSPLSGHLAKAGFTRDEIVAANLGLLEDGSGRGRAGEIKDRFFNRVMFPIADVSGKTIAFGGRVIGDGQPKYLNSSDTPIFHKSSNLYAINVAKNAIVQSGTAVVVEGYTDVIALHEAGIGNVVATLGTALGARHVKLLARFAKRIVYLFDGDEAGLRAADRAAEFLDRSSTPEAGSSRLDLAVAIIPGGQDPADFVGSAGLDATAALLADAVPLLRFVIDRRLDAHDLTTPEGRSQALSAAGRTLASVRGSILAQDYASYVAGRLLTDFETVMTAARSAQPEFTGAARDSDPEPVGGLAAGEAGAKRRVRTLDAGSRAEFEILRAITVVPELRGEVRDLLSEEDMITDSADRRLAEAVIASADAVGKDLYRAVAAIEPELAEELSNWLVDAPERDAVIATFRETVDRIKGFALRRQILRMQSRMQDTDPLKDPAGYDELFRRVAALQRQIETLRAGQEPDAKA